MALTETLSRAMDRSSPRVDETNEETLGITYEIENGALGAIKDTDRQSDWH